MEESKRVRWRQRLAGKEDEVDEADEAGVVETRKKG